jgi:hypothetical protein
MTEDELMAIEANMTALHASMCTHDDGTDPKVMFERGVLIGRNVSWARELIAEVRRLDTLLYESGERDGVTIAGLRREVESMRPIVEAAMKLHALDSELFDYSASKEWNAAERIFDSACRKAREGQG